MVTELPKSLGRLIELPLHHDERGDLIVAEAAKHVPFPIRRVFAITNVIAGGNRGHHAHKETDVALMALKGSTLVHLDDGKNKSEVLLNRPNQALCIPPRVWHSMASFTEDLVLLVLASQEYHEAEYLRDYQEYLEFVHAARR